MVRNFFILLFVLVFNFQCFPMRFHIVITGYNCETYVRDCLNSIVCQTHKDFAVTIVNDASTDSTDRQVAISAREGWKVINNDNNMGAAYNRFHVIKNIPDQEIVLLLGLDDRLKSQCLQEINDRYVHDGVWMTYGNWINHKGVGLPNDFKLHFDEQTHATRDYRKVIYRSTAPNTFYAGLFKHIPESDFQLNGKWIDTTTESEAMFSCLEMSGKDRIGVIEHAIYIYNQRRPGGTQRRLGQAYKDSVLAEIVKRPKKDLLKEF